jgi:hypothetical protein
MVGRVEPERLTEMELEILDLLRMDPETPELLTDMLSFEGQRIQEDAVRSSLDRLGARDLARPLRGWYADPSSEELVEAYWWELTEKGRAVVESRLG